MCGQSSKIFPFFRVVLTLRGTLDQSRIIGHGEVSMNVTLEFMSLMLSYVFALPSIIYQ